MQVRQRSAVAKALWFVALWAAGVASVAAAAYLIKLALAP